MTPQKNPNLILYLGILAAVVFWLLDAFIDVTFFEKEEEFLESVFEPGNHELYMRGIVLLLFVIVTFYARHLLKKQQDISTELEHHKENLEDEVKQRTEELERLATTDELTQVYNRRKLYELADYEIERSIRYKQPLSLLVLDIDHFKRINDNHGHDIGDKVLVLFSKTIMNMIRQPDIFGRVGGEEFVLILPSTDLEKAISFAERIRQSIEEETFPEIGNITISIGVTECIEDDKIHPLFKRADNALYDAKNSGRNKVISA